MLIRKIEVNNFRNLQKTCLDLQPGITLIKAKNEGGKTSIRKAIANALYADPKSTSSMLKDLATWGQICMYDIALEFTANGEDYRLQKDFEVKSSVLENLNTGKKLVDKKKIAETIADMLGLPTNTLLMSTIYFSAEELSNVKNAKDLRTRLEEKLAGVEGVSVAALLQKIEQEISKLNVGVNRPAKNPGPIKECMDRRLILKQNLQTIESEVNQFEKNQVKYNEILNRLSVLTKQFEIKSNIYEKVCSYRNAKKNINDANVKFKEFDNILKEREKLEKNKNEQFQKVENLEKRIKALGTALEMMQKALDTAFEADAIKLQISQLEKNITKITLALGAVDKAKSDRDRYTFVEPADLKKSQELVNQINALKLAGQDQGFKVDIASLSDIAPEVIIDGIMKPWDPSKKPIDVQAEVVISIPGVVEFKVTNKNLQAAKNLNKERTLSKIFSQILTKYSVAKQEQLTGLSKKWDAANQEVMNKEIELNTILDGKKLEQYQADLDILKKHFTEYQSKMELQVPPAQTAIIQVEPGIDLSGYMISLFKEKKAAYDQKVKKLREEFAMENNPYQQTIGKLNKLPSEKELEKGKEEWAMKVYIAQTAFDKLKLPDISVEQIVKLEKQIEGLNSQIKDLDTEKQRLEITMGTSKYGVEDVENIKDEILVCENRLNKYKERDQVLTKVNNLFYQARGETLRKIATEIGDNLKLYTRELTEGRYTDVEINPDDLGIIVISREKGSAIDIDNEMSTGTRDQIYFATRLAMIPAITNGRKPPIFLDDPLVYFDADRRQKACDILKKLSNEHQIIIFSCHDYYDSLADNVINLHVSKLFRGCDYDEKTNI